MPCCRLINIWNENPVFGASRVTCSILSHGSMISYWFTLGKTRLPRTRSVVCAVNNNIRRQQWEVSRSRRPRRALFIALEHIRVKEGNCNTFVPSVRTDRKVVLLGFDPIANCLLVETCSCVTDIVAIAIEWEEVRLMNFSEDDYPSLRCNDLVFFEEICGDIFIYIFFKKNTY